jgi:hypothetical protein
MTAKAGDDNDNSSCNDNSNSNCNCNCNSSCNGEIRGFFASLRMTRVGGDEMAAAA